MKRRKQFLRGAAFLAAAATAACLTLSVQNAVRTGGAPLTVYAEEAYSEGENNAFTYRKYSDHIEITGCKPWNATSIDIPTSIDGLSVTSLGIYAFEGCGAASVTIPDSVTEIGMYVFCMCDNLKEVTLPASLKSISLRSFSQCKNLTTVNFPDTMIEIGERVFDETPWLDAQRQKDPLVIVNGALIDGRTCKGDVTVPSGVKYVSGSAFAQNEDITSVVFPETVTNAALDTFWQCTNLKSADLGGMTALDSGAFGYCSKITDIKLSGKLKSIDGYAFTDNSSTATITFRGSESVWNQVQKPDNDAFLQRAKLVFDETYQPPQAQVAGDINADGKCDVSDVTMLLKYLLTSGSLTADQAKIADMNQDARLDSSDFTRIKQAALA